MNERDFDHIFRRKIEQLPNALPDDMIWQQLDNQLNNQVSSSTNWWKVSALLLLLALLGSNFYLWKKLGDNNLTASSKVIIQTDTIQKQNVVYQRDTIIKYIYIKEKNIVTTNKFSEVVFNKNKEKLVGSNTKNNTIFTEKTNTFTSKKNESNKVVSNNINDLLDKNEKNEVAKKENDADIVKEGIINTEIKNEAILSEKIPVNEIAKNINSSLQNPTKDSTLITEKNTSLLTTNKFDSLMKSIDSQDIVNKKSSESNTKTPTKIEPVKDKKLTRWTIGINTQSGVLDQKAGHGFFKGIGLSVATQFSPKWRIRTNFDAQEMEFDNRNNKDFYKHQKPNINPDDTIVRWKARDQPLAQWSLSLERLFNYKKVEFFVGVGTGVTFVFPHSINYEAKNPAGKPTFYKKENKESYAAFAGFQGNVGLSFPIYKKFSTTLSAHYQYNSNTEKLYWQNQLSTRIGLNYRF